jgi:poly(A) polymerase
VPVPIIVPRAEHQISRRDVDPDALKVLYRLHEHRYTAYLVGGSVRDLLLGRRPKDFDIGTDAHPYQIKKLFRNCWIIGRRFRLAHVKFGLKTIEVATFRRIVPEPVEGAPDDASPEPVLVASSPEPEPAAEGEHGIIHRDNTFGTPEEDAFRRDFTINGLFYDIGTFSVIDYVGGLADLTARVVRSIGDPRVRFVEDPVRMLRAVVMAARLGFDMDTLVVEAIAEHRGLIAHASPARLLEEYYKILRSGCAEATFRALGRARLLELITPELKSPPEALWDWLARLDRYRAQFPGAPAELTNTILIGSLVVPTGILERQPPPQRHAHAGAADRREPHDRMNFGILPIARKDVERLRHVVQMLPRLEDPLLSPRVARSLVHRPAFADAMVWLEVFGESPDVVERWKHAAHQYRNDGEGPPADAAQGEPQTRGRRRRRRRGRRRGRGGSGAPPTSGGHTPGHS